MVVVMRKRWWWGGHNLIRDMDTASEQSRKSKNKKEYSSASNIHHYLYRKPDWYHNHQGSNLQLTSESMGGSDQLQ